jgi:hypothetical protein
LFVALFNSARWYALHDVDLFNSVLTDGDYILFGGDARTAKVKIDPRTFMDLVLVDRTKGGMNY